VNIVVIKHKNTAPHISPLVIIVPDKVGISEIRNKIPKKLQDSFHINVLSSDLIEVCGTAKEVVDLMKAEDGDTGCPQNAVIARARYSERVVLFLVPQDGVTEEGIRAKMAQVGVHDIDWFLKIVEGSQIKTVMSNLQVAKELK
jgi:hypothetical protein